MRIGYRSKRTSPEIPKGYVWIGSLSSIKYRLVPRLAGSEVPVSASPLPRNIYTMSDESGIMGLTQGPFYVMSVSVVSNWDVYGKVVQRDSDGAFIKFNSAVDDVLDATLPELDGMLNRMYMIAIAKDGTLPPDKVQKNVHAAGILALANQVMRVEKSQRIDAAIDFSTLTQKMPIEQLYEKNAHRGARSVEARVDHARDFAPLAAHDYVTGSNARWMNGGLEIFLSRFNSELYYTVTNIDKMNRLGEKAIEAMRNNHDVMPDDDLRWTRVKLPKELPEREPKTEQKKGGQVSHEPNHGNTHRLVETTDLSDIDLSEGKTGPLSRSDRSYGSGRRCAGKYDYLGRPKKDGSKFSSVRWYKKPSPKTERPRDSRGRFVKTNSKNEGRH